MFLETIMTPSDLKKLTFDQMERLAQEIRSYLLEVVSRTGGHLAPNLGVVELSIALHYVFNSPQDKIIWDVGHQSYVHKILTGRREELKTLRQFKGLSGFPKRSESVHDCFETGHSSTSISAALGFALARDLKQEKNSVIAVIGDGALTGGMAYEALNHAGQLGTRLIVILNDNEMSITRNVGAMSGYLSRLRTDPLYHRSKEDVREVLQRIPNIGPKMFKAAERFKDSVKYLLVSGMLFEELGFTYLGPIDGHNLRILNQVLERARLLPGPVLLHVKTIKGKGYPPAEKQPNKFHGIGPFDLKTGKTRPRRVPTFTEVFGKAVIKIAEDHPELVAITAAMSEGTGLCEFSRRYPRRFFDVGIAEQHAVTMAAGLAQTGCLPVVAIYSTFLQRAYDQIVHDVALQNLHIIFALDRAGIVGEDGETHQGVFDLSYLRHIPRMTVMAPRDQSELVAMLKSSLKYSGPIAIRYPRGSGPQEEVDYRLPVLPFGRGELLREGEDLVILAVGPLVYQALEAAEQLSMKGKEAAVINCRFVKPLDEELILEWSNRTKKVITIEENVIAGGFGSAVLELLADRGFNGEAARMGIPDSFLGHGAPDLLCRSIGLNAAGIIDLIKSKGWLDS
ncbi:1-deoxy-D-xylulose-5-phosphate synthase [Syntrophaceticus schinkii]|uniref:1-deoxy-D-xylulose-5-phosphate synthase n=1 Tax=Syntrophaceticus schinkii TaxID=499207 RepID=A0A0B7MQA1_9FIRM|nr:1-deoxy-D-xylulose-5-phosphate synthase [Syntrophaceticus schinkii]CEO89872.1 1-deoxyxylulose-5-phosphate synthase [Syntrophaceticus schinkii]